MYYYNMIHIKLYYNCMPPVPAPCYRPATCILYSAYGAPKGV